MTVTAICVTLTPRSVARLDFSAASLTLVKSATYGRGRYCSPRHIIIGYQLTPVSAMTTPDSPESNLSTNQGRGEMMQCPLTN